MEMVLIFTFCLILAGTDAVTTVTGYRGQPIQIKCSYTSGYENHKKYLCRDKCLIPGFKDVPVQSGSPAKDSRFSLYDDKTAKVFTVTITDLRDEDGGTYWCGIEGTGLHKYRTFLQVVKMAFPTSTVITAVSVVLLLLLTIAIEKKKKTQGSETETQSPRETNEDYENDQNFLPVTGRENVALSESVYQSLNPATNQSDSVYDSLNLTNNQSDSFYQSLNLTNNQSDSVYQSLNLINNQSDSIYQSLNLTNNQSDSIYQSLNLTNNQSDSIYHTLTVTSNN